MHFLRILKIPILSCRKLVPHKGIIREIHGKDQVYTLYLVACIRQLLYSL